MADWSRSVAGGVHSVNCVMSAVSGRSGAFETGGPVACISLIRGPRMQHHWPLPGRWTSRQDGPMREGASRDLGTRPGAGRSWRLGAQMSALPWAVATPVSYTHLTLPTNREV